MALMISCATTPPTTAHTGLSSPNNNPAKEEILIETLIIV